MEGSFFGPLAPGRAEEEGDQVELDIMCEPGKWEAVSEGGGEGGRQGAVSEVHPAKLRAEDIGDVI